MFVDKSLLIKGIAGVAAIGVGGTGFVYREEIGDMFRTKEQVERRRINGILGALGLGEDCRVNDKTDPSTFTKECGLDEEKLGMIKFSNRGKGELKIDGDIPPDLKLKIEGTKEDISFSFLNIPASSPIKLFGDKTKGKIVLKTDKKFKVEGGRLTKDSTDVDAKLKSQLEEFNKQLGSVNAPQECRFDESEGETTVECSVASDELKKIAFSNKGRGELTYSSDSSDFTGMKLKVNTHEEMVDTRDGTNDRVMYLTFKDYNKTVKLMKGNKEVVSFIKNTNPEFGIGEVEDGVLSKLWEPKDFRFRGEFSLTCDIAEGQTKGECTFDPMVKTIKVKKANVDENVEVEIADTNKNKLEIHKDQEGFNQGFKFVFKGDKVSSSDGSACLESDKEYEFKWKLQSSTKIGYLSKKST